VKKQDRCQRSGCKFEPLCDVACLNSSSKKSCASAEEKCDEALGYLYCEAVGAEEFCERSTCSNKYLCVSIEPITEWVR